MFAKHIMTQNFYGTCLALSPFIVQSTTRHKEAGCNQSSMSSNISQTGGNLQLLRFPFLSLWCDNYFWIMFATNPVPTNINKWGFWWFLSNMIPYGMICWIGHSKPRDWRDLRPRHSCSNRPRALQQQEGNLRWTVDPWDPLRICYFSDLLGGIMWDISDIKKNNDYIGSHSAASCRVRRPPRRVLRQPNSSGLQGVFDLFTKMQNDETQSLEHLRNLCFLFLFFPDFLKFSWDDVMHDVRWSSSAACRASARVRLVPPEVIVGPWAKINMKKNMY